MQRSRQQPRENLLTVQRTGGGTVDLTGANYFVCTPDLRAQLVSHIESVRGGELVTFKGQPLGRKTCFCLRWFASFWVHLPACIECGASKQF